MCMCHNINLYVYKTQHDSLTLGLKTWSRCRLICSSSKLSVLQRGGPTTSKSKIPPKKIHRDRLWAVTKKDCVQLTHCQQSCTNRPLIRWCDSQPKPCLVPAEPRSIDSLKTFPNERDNHLSYRTVHLRPDTHFVPRTVLTKFQDSSVLCPRSEISHSATSRSPFSLPPIANLSFRSNTKSFHCLSRRSLRANNGFVPKSSRFPTPRVGPILW